MTSSLPALFSSRDKFEQQFLQGLKKLLDEPSLGSYILALANGTLSSSLFTPMSATLLEQFSHFKTMLHEAMQKGVDPNIANDDLVVFLKLCLLGFDQLNLAEQKLVDQWQVHFNHLRAFRPQRMTTQAAPPLKVPFDQTGFHFDKPFLQKEALWEGTCLDKNISLYYNKYPFTDFHCLLIPEKALHHPQYLTESLHSYIMSLIKQLSAQFNDLKIGYNAMGAFASVNHCHFQFCLPKQPFPIESSLWQHNNGSQTYPATVHKFHSTDDSWSCIETLHRQAQTYNLLYTTDGCYVIPRKAQGTYQSVDWSSGFTWFELSGGMITFNRQHYDEISSRDILSALSATQT